MKINNPYMRVLDENDRYFIGHIYEDAYLIDKRTEEELFYDVFRGNPSCGLISRNNDWAVIAGEHLSIWRKGQTTKIEKAEMRNVHALRSNNMEIVELLIDPWADNSAIWQLDIVTLEFSKVRDFDDYREKEYTEEVIW